jgi:hypothetical protein
MTVSDTRRPLPPIEMLQPLREQGWSLSRIANHFGISKSGAGKVLAGCEVPPVARAYRDDLPPGNVLADEIKWSSITAVAAKYGASRDTVSRKSAPFRNPKAEEPKPMLLPDGYAIPDWPDAACNNEDPELFFPDPGRDGRKTAREQAQLAVAVCSGCPRRDECRVRAHVMKTGDGVWGGVWINDGKVIPLVDKKTA